MIPKLLIIVFSTLIWATHAYAELILAAGIWDSQGYGFAFRLDDTLRRDIELSLLGLKERRELEPLISEWL